MTKTISIFNQSGGVGKTTLAMNLGYHLAAEANKKVLLADLDPQASLTTFLGLSPFDLEATIFQALMDKTSPPIYQEMLDCPGLDLTPANIFLSKAELRLTSEFNREHRLSLAFKEAYQEYDVIIVDCPPSLGLLSINCLVAANLLLVPIQTEYKSVEATMNMLQTAYEICQEVNPQLKIFGAVPTMYDDRLSQARKALQTIEAIFEDLRAYPGFADAIIFDPIPRRTDFANAAAEHLPLAQYAPKHPALEPLRAMTSALEEIL